MIEKQIKSKERVRNLGEVFTPKWIVDDMLNMLEPITIEKTFLEPTCGNGNFVVEIYRRKFSLCKSQKDLETALESVVAIDIMADNVQECKNRVKVLYEEFGGKQKIDNILDIQIFQGNSLAVMSLLSSKCPVNIIFCRSDK